MADIYVDSQRAEKIWVDNNECDAVWIDGCRITFEETKRTGWQKISGGSGSFKIDLTGKNEANLYPTGVRLRGVTTSVYTPPAMKSSWSSTTTFGTTSGNWVGGNYSASVPSGGTFYSLRGEVAGYKQKDDTNVNALMSQTKVGNHPDGAAISISITGSPTTYTFSPVSLTTVTLWGASKSGHSITFKGRVQTTYSVPGYTTYYDTADPVVKVNNKTIVNLTGYSISNNAVWPATGGFVYDGARWSAFAGMNIINNTISATVGGSGQMYVEVLYTYR